MKTLTKPNTFARFNISAHLRTVEEQISDLQSMYDFSDPVVHNAVCVSLNQRVKVSKGEDIVYWREVYNAIKSM